MVICCSIAFLTATFWLALRLCVCSALSAIVAAVICGTMLFEQSAVAFHKTLAMGVVGSVPLLCGGAAAIALAAFKSGVAMGGVPTEDKILEHISCHLNVLIPLVIKTSFSKSICEFETR